MVIFHLYNLYLEKVEPEAILCIRGYYFLKTCNILTYKAHNFLFLIYTNSILDDEAAGCVYCFHTLFTPQEIFCVAARFKSCTRFKVKFVLNCTGP